MGGDSENEPLTNQRMMKKTIKEQILLDIQTLFNSKFVVDITIDYLIQ